MTTPVSHDDSPGTDPGPVVTAVDVVRRSGERDSAVGKSTLMHGKEA
jgi:hypothetical protein